MTVRRIMDLLHFSPGHAGYGFLIPTMILIISMLSAPAVRAADTDPVQVGYIYIADSAELLSDAEEDELYNIMHDGTYYGDMVFVTITDADGYNSSDYIERLYQTSSELAGRDAVIFLIDMDNRLLWISGYGALKNVITPDYGNLITDNIYRYAKDGEFGRCAAEGYRQIVRKLGGERISGPLRTGGNLCIALILAEVLCFLYAYMGSVARKTDESDILDNVVRQINIYNPSVVKTRTQKIYDPPSSSSGGGSRGGGHSSGGGFHGGGGGHGF